MAEKWEKIIYILKRLIKEKFTGDIEITFNQGGIRGVKKISKENINEKG